MASAQIELNKKREAELIKMQGDAQAQSEEHERAVADMRKKHQQALSDLQEQVKIPCALCETLELNFVATDTCRTDLITATCIVIVSYRYRTYTVD